MAAIDAISKHNRTFIRECCKELLSALKMWASNTIAKDSITLVVTFERAEMQTKLKEKDTNSKYKP